MIRCRAEDIRHYIFRPTDALLVDANVWLDVYAPSDPTDWRVKVYSRALKEMVVARSQLYIDVLIVSEFINTYARWEHGFQYPDPSARPSFKQFRQSPDFKPVAQAIADATRRILQLCVRSESGFAALDIDALIKEFELGETDFNDQIIADLCKHQGWKLVTHDGDFKNYDLAVLTANRHLLP